MGKLLTIFNHATHKKIKVFVTILNRNPTQCQPKMSKCHIRITVLNYTVSSGHLVCNQAIPDERDKGKCLFSQLVPLQLVAKVPGRDLPFVLWDNKVRKKYRAHIVEDFCVEPEVLGK